VDFPARYTATITGTGTVNGVAGYTFTATITNGSPDHFEIVILKSGNPYYSALFGEST
jgi:hypothetical protein